MEWEHKQLLTNTLRDEVSSYKNKRLFKEQMFIVAESFLLDHRSRHRQKKFKDIMFKIHGKDKFEQRTKFIENNINHSLGYFSSFSKNNFYQETNILR